MRILQVHNKYKQAGGEDVVCDQEYELLSRSGIQVERYIVDNSVEIQSLFSKIRLVFKTHYSASSRNVVTDLIEREDIGLMHVHNFFPLLTPSIFDASYDKGIPSVLTLHNYRLIHPGGLLINAGEIDERSVKGSAYECVLDGVYRDSILQTLVVAHMIEYHRRRGTWKQKVDRFIALTEFARKKFMEGGIPGEKISVKPNFVQDPLAGADGNIHQKDDYFIFIGRISREKGIETLVETWKRYDVPAKVYIFGDGPLLELLKKETGDSEYIVWMGHRSRDEVFRFLKKAKALLFPSIWYEGFPMTIVEALSFGTPVISTNIGSQSEIIDDGSTGLHMDVKNQEELYTKIMELIENRDWAQQLSRNARKEYEQKYTPEKNLEQLTAIYDELYQEYK